VTPHTHLYRIAIIALATSAEPFRSFFQSDSTSSVDIGQPFR
jgi:hypothetical protein